MAQFGVLQQQGAQLAFGVYVCLGAGVYTTRTW